MQSCQRITLLYKIRSDGIVPHFRRYQSSWNFLSSFDRWNWVAPNPDSRQFDTKQVRLHVNKEGQEGCGRWAGQAKLSSHVPPAPAKGVLLATTTEFVVRTVGLLERLSQIPKNKILTAGFHLHSVIYAQKASENQNTSCCAL